jgi:hypothetical protein
MRSVLCLAALLASHAWAAPVPTPAQLRTIVEPNLAVALPSVESLVGIRIPPRSPLLVVSSFGDRGTPPDVDRGYAVGRTLNELLFGAHGQLDVETPGYYALDTSGPGVVVGPARDARANAYRVAARESAQWCLYGTVEGNAPAFRVVTTVDRCRDGTEAARKVFAVGSDAAWPQALRDICDFVIASTTAGPSARSQAACGRAAAIRPASFLAYGAYAASSGMPRERVEAIVAVDPKFAPAALDLIDRMSAGEDKASFWRQLDALSKAAGATPAIVMAATARQLAGTWKLEHRPYLELYELIRANPQLRGPWLLLASSLSEAVTWDHPSGSKVIEWLKDLVGWEGANYSPNEATHSAALAVSLDYYATWPDSYRAHWQVGYALMRYAWMVRGNETWSRVPRHGKKAFKPLMELADEFMASALVSQPAAAGLWANRIETAYHTRGDWRATLDAAAKNVPHAQRIYETAMNYALSQWGGSEDDRQYVWNLAVHNNPDVIWAKTLIERHARKPE